ncbi:MAG: hypothetical protein H0X31_01060 [Nostocaceae cyanobacterium]|nr:hypothetical protein [Nostocaceae cyanobacterium]
MSLTRAYRIQDEYFADVGAKTAIDMLGDYSNPVRDVFWSAIDKVLKLQAQGGTDINL